MEETIIRENKLGGMEFYRKTLNSPVYVVAPMVDQSELAWRLLCRRYGADLCYSPMFHSSLFCKDLKYRKEALQTCPEDRPLIIQFCGNDPGTILEAAKLAQDHCDAVDINLGCPQAIARKGHYGAYLQDEWELLGKIVSTLHKNLDVPVTCKIRVFEDEQKTLNYAKMLEDSGCQMLTVHGRTREMKGPLTGVADWTIIKKVKDHVSIPVLANGNIMSIEDVHRCLAATGVEGVMSAEGNLYNPTLFSGRNAVSWEIAEEYLDLVDQYPCPVSFIRGHLFKILHHLLAVPSNSCFRDIIAVSHSMSLFRRALQGLKDKYLDIHDGTRKYEPENEIIEGYDLSIPPWICHSYVRMPPDQHILKLEEAERDASDPNSIKRHFYDNDGNQISRKKMKKLRRVQRRINKKPNRPEFRQERSNELCGNCQNPKGLTCVQNLCRICCKNRCFTEELDCRGHRVFVKTNRARARLGLAFENVQQNVE